MTGNGENYDLRVLRAFRRIVRAIDVHSRELVQRHDVTGPQLVCLQTLAADGPIPNSKLAERVYLSPSTVVGILDRLEEKGLVARSRSHQDRRFVLVSATEPGRRLAAEAPSPLQSQLAAALRALPEREQATIATSLERIVDLMEAKDLDASPFLETGPIGPANGGPGAPAQRGRKST